MGLLWVWSREVGWRHGSHDDTNYGHTAYMVEQLYLKTYLYQIVIHIYDNICRFIIFITFIYISVIYTSVVCIYIDVDGIANVIIFL